jgi:hypothetical protein
MLHLSWDFETTMLSLDSCHDLDMALVSFKFHMLKFNAHHEVLREWKLSSTLAFRNGAFEK